MNWAGAFIITGNPYKFVYDLALEKLEISDKSKVIGIGDSLHTDINGAHGAGIQGALVMSGLHGHELGFSNGDMPTPKDVDTMTLHYNTVADYYLPDLRW